MFRRIAARQPAIRLKTGLMLGLGETDEELLDTLADLAAAGCRMLTLGQYLQPSPAQMPVVRYLPLEEFERLGEAGPAAGVRAGGRRPAGPLQLPRPRNGGSRAGKRGQFSVGESLR